MISFLMKTPLPSSKVDTIFGFFCFPFLCRFFCFIVSSADFGKESIPFVFSIRISFFYRLDELPALAFCFIWIVCFLVILSSMLDDDDEGVPRPRQRNVVTDGTLLRRQELPRAAQLVATDDYFFLIVAEIYSPSKFYWFLKDQRRAIETVGVAVWLCTRAGATPISFFFPPFFVSGLSKLLRTIRRPASAVVVAVVGCVDVVLSSMVRFFFGFGNAAVGRHDRVLHDQLGVRAGAPRPLPRPGAGRRVRRPRLVPRPHRRLPRRPKGDAFLLFCFFFHFFVPFFLALFFFFRSHFEDSFFCVSLVQCLRDPSFTESYRVLPSFWRCFFF